MDIEITTHEIEEQTDTIVYPESDGKPMADNTLQFRWIVTLQGGLDVLFRERPDIFVAGDLLWYPVQGNNRLRIAPDALVVFGRPKGERGSYLQWREAGIAPQVVFEVLSPNNTTSEMERKRYFYEKYGVEEFYIYDPDRIELEGWWRTTKTEKLAPVAEMHGWVSPRLGIRFVLGPSELEVYRPDGERFASYLELEAQYTEERQRAEQERQRAEQERQRAERLAQQLRALGVDPDQLN